MAWMPTGSFGTCRARTRSRFRALSALVAFGDSSTLQRSGVAFRSPRCALKITRRPDAVSAKVFEVCGLGQVDTGRARRVFRRDAQAGTVLERERPGEEHLRLSANQVATVRAVVARHPLVSAWPEELPSTLALF